MAGESMEAGMPGGGGAGKNTFHLSADMLPPGMAQKVNVDDILEFRVVAKPDSDGDIEVSYNYGEEGKGGEGEYAEDKGGEGGEQSWEDEFRHEMSPRAEQEGAM